MTKKVTPQDINTMKRLAKKMPYERVGEMLGFSGSTVAYYCKGIRKKGINRRVYRPKHPCPKCGSTWIMSRGELWFCNSCGKYFTKNLSNRG